MKKFPSNFLSFTVVIVILSFSCNSSPSEAVKKQFAIQVTDSINVDYFGNLVLKDYEPVSDKYLLSNIGLQPMLEVNNQGSVINHLEVTQEGPNAVPSPGTAGYLEGELIIYDMEKGFVRLNEDRSITHVTSIPYPHSYLVFPPHLPIVKKTGEEVFYNKPLTDNDSVDGIGEKFYQNYYNLPLLEKLNLSTGDTASYIKIPDQSIFKDGLNHGLYIPIIKNRGKEWYVSTWFDPFIYVFEQEGDVFSLVRTIDLQIEGMVNYEPISMKNSDQFYDANANIRAGNINDILFLEDYVLIVYRKGLSAEQQGQIKADYPEDFDIEVKKRDPFYAVVLDNDHHVLTHEVLFPSGVYYPNVVNTYDEIVSLKDPELFQVEEDYVTLYKMKLVEK